MGNQEITARKVETPEDFAAFVAQEQGKIAEACQELGELRSKDASLMTGRDARSYTRDMKNAQGEVMHYDDIVKAARNVPDFVYSGNTLNPAGAAAVLQSGTVPANLLPDGLSQEEAMLRLQSEGDAAQEYATKLSNMFDLPIVAALPQMPTSAEEAMATYNGMLDEICDKGFTPQPSLPDNSPLRLPTLQK